ncbi:hypothetical protein CR513_35828, partial [Mucuna pruriens]
MEEYHNEIEMDVMIAQTKESDEATMAWFLHRINKKIQDVMEENTWKEKARREKSPKKWSDSFLGQKETTSTCAPMALGTSNIKWFKCLGKGHIPFQCPNRRFMIVKDDGEIESLRVESCVNVASEKLVKKLDLPTFVHPRPCKLQWLNKQAKVTFTLGGYEHNVVYDEVTNRFTFVHLVQRMMLKPLSPMEVHKDQKKGVLANVLPKDIFDGLPPLRGIEHHIDLTLKVIYPNKIAYRINPKEAEEIQKQFGKMIEKGWVRESISPCTMLVILVPKKDSIGRMCTYYGLINNIIVRYRHPITHLDYMLKELHGSNIFSKIDLRSG